MSTGTSEQILKSSMPEIIFPKKELQTGNLELYMFWSNFFFFLGGGGGGGGTVLGRFGQCFFLTFRRRPIMVAVVFTQSLTIKKFPAAQLKDYRTKNYVGT